MTDADAERPSTTEDVPEAPGWAESEVDAILSDLPGTPALAALRAHYLDCLAGIGGHADLDGAHDRCRAALLRGLRAEQADEAAIRRIDERLAALEAEITART